MDFFDTVRSRRSIRSYTSQPVEESKLKKVLEAARLAPSWKNKQPWIFILVAEEEDKQALAQALHEENRAKEAVATAPLVIVVCADPQVYEQWEDKQYFLVDAAIAMEHLILAATAVGLGTCWVSWLYEAKVREVLDIPDHIRILSLTPLGYTGEELPPPSRKDLKEIVYWGKWEA